MGSSAIGLNGPIGVQEGRNKIINGDFAFWQRGNTASFGISTGTTFDYTSDRWYYYAQTAAGGTLPSVTINKKSFSFASTDPDTNPVPKQYLRLGTGSTGGETFGDFLAFLEQRIEGVETFAGQSATLSFWGRSTVTNRVVQVSAHQFFDGGSATTHTAGVTFGLTNSWVKYNTTFSIPSVTGKTLGSGATNDYLSVRFNLASGSTASGGYMYNVLNWAGVTEDIELSQVQLEENPKPTNFEQLDEESQAQRVERFYEIVPVHPIIYGTSNNSATNHSLTMKRTEDYFVQFREAGSFIQRNENRGLSAIDKKKDSLTAYVTDNGGDDGDVIPKFTLDYGSGNNTSNLDGYIRLSVDNEIHTGSTGGQ